MDGPDRRALERRADKVADAERESGKAKAKGKSLSAAFFEPKKRKTTTTSSSSCRVNECTVGGGFSDFRSQI